MQSENQSGAPVYSAQQRLWQAFLRWFGIVLPKSTSTQITLGAVAHLPLLN